jgi:saccharopine dehydrogenase-like NADP-dependent oxidoreductase
MGQDGAAELPSVVILGGAGGIGKVISRTLAGMSTFDEVVIADLAVERSQEIARTIGSEKLRVERLDFRETGSLEGLLRNSDIAVNCSWDDFNVRVTDAVLKTSTDMIDLSSSMDGAELVQLGRNREALDAGVTIVLELGMDPGLSNLLAKTLTQDMDEVDSIQIRDGDKDTNPSAYPFKFTVRGVLEEWTWNAVTWDHGKFVLESPLSRWEDTVFPAPLGQLRTYLTPHEEPITLPKFLGKKVGHVDFMLAQAFDLYSALSKLNLMSRKEFDFHGVVTSPYEFLASYLARAQASNAADEEITDSTCVLIRTRGRTAKQERIERTGYVLGWSRAGWCACAAHVVTGVSAALGASLLATGKVKGPGILPPESCVDPADILPRLKEYGIHVSLPE